MLRGFRLEFFRRLEIRHVCQMDAERVLAEFPSQLAHCLEIWGGLDVAHGASYFGYHEVELAGVAEHLDVSFYLVGDVGYDLDCLAEIVSTALLVDY